jgi:hypothetical protein
VSGAATKSGPKPSAHARSAAVSMDPEARERDERAEERHDDEHRESTRASSAQK